MPSLDLTEGGVTESHLRALSTAISINNLYRYCDIEWDRYWLSSNPGLTIDLYNNIDTILPNTKGEWCYRELFWNLGQREIIELPDTVKIKRDLPSGYRLPHGHRTIAWIEEHYEKYLWGSWSWYYITRDHMTIAQLIELRNDPEWAHCANVCWCFCYREDTTLALANRQDPGQDGYHQWHWENLTRYVDPEEILRHPNLPWVEGEMLRNRKLTLALCREWHRRRYGHRQGYTGMSYTRRLLNRIAGTIQYSELIQIPDYERLPWSLGWLSRNPTMNVRWLREVVRRWPRVYGKFDYGALERREDPISRGIYTTYLWHRKEPQIVLHDDITISQVYFLVWYHRKPCWDGKVLPLVFDDVMRAQGIEISDLQRLFPKCRRSTPKVRTNMPYQDISIRLMA